MTVHDWPLYCHGTFAWLGMVGLYGLQVRIFYLPENWKRDFLWALIVAFLLLDVVRFEVGGWKYLMNKVRKKIVEKKKLFHSIKYIFLIMQRYFIKYWIIYGKCRFFFLETIYYNPKIQNFNYFLRFFSFFNSYLNLLNKTKNNSKMDNYMWYMYIVQMLSHRLS